MAERKDKGGWGGTWTEEKLHAFEQYVKAYLQIMDAQRNKYGWKLVYFDAFAGSGSRENKDVSTGFNIEAEELNVYKGAAERVLAIKKEFDYYYFIDSDQKASNILKRKLEGGVANPKLVFRVGDANEQIKKLGSLLKRDKSYKSLVLLDPFGMQVNWDALTCLQSTSTDLWILLPSGIAINRLLPRDGTLKSQKLLEGYFGIPQNEILTYFYAQKTEKTLFGDETIPSKFAQPIKRIADLYVERLRSLFKYVSTPMVLENSQKFPIYHFVFASNNATALKIADYIIGKGKK